MTVYSQSNNKFDLEERTTVFGMQIIDFSRSIKRDPITTSIVNQLIRSGTSIGANYCEASEASSGRDFINKIGIAKKESKETKYWLKLLAHAVPEATAEAQRLWQEAHELNLIFAAISRKVASGGR